MKYGAAGATYTRPVRILLAHAFYRVPGGEDSYVRAQAELLGARHDVELLGPVNDTLSKAGAAHRLTYSGAARREVSATVDRFRPDLVHLHNPYPSLGPAVHLTARRRAVPLVMTVHNLRLRCPNGLMFTEGELCRRCEGGMYAHAALHRCFPTRAQGALYGAALWTHRFLLRVESSVAGFVAPSRFMAARLREWSIPAGKIHLVRPFVPASPRPEDGPGEYGLFLGRLSNEKGVDVLLDALAAAGDPPFRIAGGGPADDRLRARARDLGLKRTDFLGLVPRAEVPGLLAGARYVAAPSLSEENAPLAVLEAMAAARPVIATRRGGLPELVEEGRGLGVEARDGAALAGAIETLAVDPALCQTLGDAARRFVEDELTEEAHLKSLESAYGRVAGAAGA